MIDFENARFIKLRLVKDTTFQKMVNPLFVDEETIVMSFQSVRDGIVFTNKRIISINIQELTGKKKDFTSLPYSKISAFSVESAGVFDMDSELELWYAGLGKVRFELVGRADISAICRVISEHAL